MDIKEIIHDKLIEMEFKKKKTIYMRESSPITALAKISKSKFGDKYMIDVGVVHNELSSRDLLYPFLGWHLSARLDQVSIDHLMVLAALDMEKPMLELDRIAIIRSALDFADSVCRRDWENEEWLFSEALSGRREFVIPDVLIEFAKARSSL